MTIAFKLTLIAVQIYCLLMPVPATATQDVIWVTVEGSAEVIDGNVEKARESAIENAEQKAIRDVIVANISLESLLVNLKLSGTMVGAIPHGKIIESQIIDEKADSIIGKIENTSSHFYKVKLKAGVIESTTSEDKAFQIEAKLNQSDFLDGDEMQIHLNSTEDCFYSIFILMENEKVLKLIPNRFRENNFLESNRAYKIPDIEDNQKDIILRVYVPPNKSFTKEAVYILALKQPFYLDNTDIQEGIYGIYSGQSVFIDELINEIIDIPLEDRAEVLIPYTIIKSN
jgi:hypothetical protein